METTTITMYKANNGCWLYKEETIDGVVTRNFASQVMNADGSWQECTDAEKLAWEEAHKPQSIPDPAEQDTTDAPPTA